VMRRGRRSCYSSRIATEKYLRYLSLQPHLQLQPSRGTVVSVSCLALCVHTTPSSSPFSYYFRVLPPSLFVQSHAIPEYNRPSHRIVVIPSKPTQELQTTNEAVHVCSLDVETITTHEGRGKRSVNCTDELHCVILLPHAIPHRTARQQHTARTRHTTELADN